MKVKILAIGKQKSSPEKAIVDYYLKMSKWKSDIVELEIKNFSSVQHRRIQEAKEILKHIDKDKDIVIALDAKGKELDSGLFASTLSNYQDSGKNICFVIGGSDGLDSSVIDRANLVLSFGRMTLPHMLIRAVLCEQIYRAGTIIEGHPYNK